MTITGDYAHPITVNGYSCKNCTDVDYAKKHIDPAHPKDGPYGVNSKASDMDSHGRPGAVSFGGQLAGLSAAASSVQSPFASSTVIDLRV